MRKMTRRAVSGRPCLKARPNEPHSCAKREAQAGGSLRTRTSPTLSRRTVSVRLYEHPS
jgi:hypothetical protein